MRLGTELKDGGNEPVRSLSRFLPTRRPDDNSINALVYDSGGGDEGGGITAAAGKHATKSPPCTPKMRPGEEKSSSKKTPKILTLKWKIVG